jgi:hypothetical protein
VKVAVDGRGRGSQRRNPTSRYQKESDWCILNRAREAKMEIRGDTFALCN